MAVILLGDIMRPDPATVQSVETVREATNLMSQCAFRHLVVVTPAGKPVGVISQRDLFRHLATAGVGSGDASLRAVMSEPLVSASPELHAKEAAELMLVHRIGCLPVTEEGKLVGIVTRSDLLARGEW